MGFLAPGSAHARPSTQPPIDNSGNFSAQVSERGVKKVDKFLINFLAISGDSKHFSGVFRRNPKKSTPRGAGGSPKFLITLNLIFFVT